MKTIFVAAALLLSSGAHALTADEITKTLGHPEIKKLLDSASIDKIEQGPSPRCAGCFGLKLTIYRHDLKKELAYSVQGMDFGGEFRLDIQPQP